MLNEDQLFICKFLCEVELNYVKLSLFM